MKWTKISFEEENSQSEFSGAWKAVSFYRGRWSTKGFPCRNRCVLLSLLPAHRDSNARSVYNRKRGMNLLARDGFTQQRSSCCLTDSCVGFTQQRSSCRLTDSCVGFTQQRSSCCLTDSCVGFTQQRSSCCLTDSLMHWIHAAYIIAVPELLPMTHAPTQHIKLNISRYNCLTRNDLSWVVQSSLSLNQWKCNSKIITNYFNLN